MKVTPLEIRQKSFERTLRGYDKDEVNAFLLSLSQEWERILDDMKELRMKSEVAEREVAKLREVETSLFKTLKTAEDTGAHVVEQANKSAELHMRETQLKVEAMIQEAKNKAKNMLEEAEATSRQLVDDMEDRLKALTQEYKMLELHRENLLSDLKRLANETIDRVDRAKQLANAFNPDQHVNQARREVKKILVSTPEPPKNTVMAPVNPPPLKSEETKPVMVEDLFQKSFFDDIH
jgi:cell division initiation protein